MKSPSLYFLAIIPSTELEDKIMKLKQYMWDSYGTKAALRSPPHITLYMPFKYPDSREEKLISNLKRYIRNFNPFSIQLKDFGSFDGGVIFVDVMERSEMEKLHLGLNQWMKIDLNVYSRDNPYRGFTPHITIAFRDLKKANFKIAREEFSRKTFDEIFTVEGVYLLKHNGRSWDKHKYLPFNQQN